VLSPVKRWDAYWQDFEKYIEDADRLRSSSVTTSSPTALDRFMNGEIPYEEYEFHNEAELARFMVRWNLHPAFAGQELVSVASKHRLASNAYSTLISLYPTPWLVMLSKYWKGSGFSPRFQVLNVLDLPQELKERIFDFCDPKRVISLASTCRAMYASGCSHLFHVG
jgi:F-box-like domain